MHRELLTKYLIVPQNELFREARQIQVMITVILNSSTEKCEQYFHLPRSESLAE